MTITDSGGRRVCETDLRNALDSYRFDPDIGGGFRIENPDTLAKTVKRSVNARKPASRKAAPLLFTVRVNTGEGVSQQAMRMRAVAGRLNRGDRWMARAVRAKALDNAKGTAFTLKVPVGPGKVKARLVAQEVQTAVANEFNAFATVKRQYESR